MRGKYLGDLRALLSEECGALWDLMMELLSRLLYGYETQDVLRRDRLQNKRKQKI